MPKKKKTSTKKKSLKKKLTAVRLKSSKPAQAKRIVRKKAVVKARAASPTIRSGSLLEILAQAEDRPSSGEGNGRPGSNGAGNGLPNSDDLDEKRLQRQGSDD